ncbi:MAG: type II toxin-antitoxin system VapC family toxin [Rickettsiaceae bacterium]|nr:type II toxin-antitoxin system VapC family toxin [Rickettsiaceae bacterium]
MTNKTQDGPCLKILDSSAIIALIFEESGHEIACDALSNAIMSSINYCEVISILSQKIPLEEIKPILQKLITKVIEFDEEDAFLCGALHQKTREYGLSLGDRACISLGEKLNVPVYTADRIWEKVQKYTKTPIIIIR